MSIMTVLGSIPASESGIISPHEHIIVDTTNFFIEPDSAADKIQAYKKIDSMRDLSRLRLNPASMRDNYILSDNDTQREEVLEFKRAGGKTIVDATLPGIGRNVEYLRDLSLCTDLNIIAGTGFYVANSHPPVVHESDRKGVSTIIMKEIRDGIDDTGIKPGIIGEIGVNYEFHPEEKKVLRAAADAHKETGLPLMVHINPWSENGIEAVSILQEESIMLNRVCICHIDGENRRDYIYRLLESGCFIEFDNFGKEFSVLDHSRIHKGNFGKFVSDWQREELLIELLNKGFEDQILISCDVCLKMFLKAYGGLGYDHIIKNIVPELKMYGVNQAVIDKLTISNPACFLNV